MLGAEVLEVILVADLDRNRLHRGLAADIAYERNSFQQNSPFAGAIVPDATRIRLRRRIVCFLWSCA